MIYENKKIRRILDEYSQKDPENAYHMKSKLNCYRFEQQINLCAKLIPKKAKIVDMGCGWGHVCAVLSLMRPDLKIIGIDTKKGGVWEMIKKKKFKCDFEVMDALNTKFKKEMFDAVISFGVMEHVKDENKFLKEIRRILKKGGLNLVFNLPNKYSLNEFGAKIVRIKSHKKRYVKKEIKELFEKNNFKNIKIRREFFIPAQVNRISERLNSFFNKYYKSIDRVDKFIMKTPLDVFAEAYQIICRK